MTSYSRLYLSYVLIIAMICLDSTWSRLFTEVKRESEIGVKASCEVSRVKVLDFYTANMQVSREIYFYSHVF